MKIKPLFTFSLFTLAILLFAGCKGSGFVLVEWDKSHLAPEKPIDKLVVLDPSFVFLNEEESSRFIEKREENKLRYVQILEEMSKAAKLDLKVVIPENLTSKDALWFNSLAALRRHLFNVNFIQDSDLSGTKKTGYSRVPSRYAEALPILDAKYAALTKTLGTPYVASSICVVGNKDATRLDKGRRLLLHIVVNINTGKTVFREVREMSGFPNDTRLKGAIYDSFNILKHPKAPRSL